MTDKQQRFAEEYLKDLNAKAAAVRSGYSESSAKEIGYQLLQDPEIEEYVQKLKEQRSKRTQVTADMVVNELAKIAFANIQDYITDNNGIRDISRIKRKKAAAVSAIKHTKRTYAPEDGEPITTEQVEFRLHDKISALNKLGDHLGMWKNQEHKPDKLIIEFANPLDETDPDEDNPSEAA